MIMVVTGSGKVSSAIATADIRKAYGPKRSLHIMNVGLAGAARADIGSLWLALK